VITEKYGTISPWNRNREGKVVVRVADLFKSGFVEVEQATQNEFEVTDRHHPYRTDDAINSSKSARTISLECNVSHEFFMEKLVLEEGENSMAGV